MFLAFATSLQLSHKTPEYFELHKNCWPEFQLINFAYFYNSAYWRNKNISIIYATGNVNSDFKLYLIRHLCRLLLIRENVFANDVLKVKCSTCSTIYFSLKWERWCGGKSESFGKFRVCSIVDLPSKTQLKGGGLYYLLIAMTTTHNELHDKIPSTIISK